MDEKALLLQEIAKYERLLSKTSQTQTTTIRTMTNGYKKTDPTHPAHVTPHTALHKRHSTAVTNNNMSVESLQKLLLLDAKPSLSVLQLAGLGADGKPAPPKMSHKLPQAALVKRRTKQPQGAASSRHKYSLVNKTNQVTLARSVNQVALPRSVSREDAVSGGGEKGSNKKYVMERTLIKSLENISSIYKSLVREAAGNNKKRPRNSSSSSSKVSVYKSRTQLLNRYVPKTKKQVYKSSTKLVNKFVAPSPSLNPHYARPGPHLRTTPPSRDRSKGYVSIHGQLYRRRASREYDTKYAVKNRVSQITPDQVKHLQIRGVPFTMSGDGQKLKRVSLNLAKPAPHKTDHSTPRKLLLGDKIFVRNSNADYVKKSDRSLQKLASRKVVQSLNVIRQRGEKERNRHCLFYNRFGRCSKGEKCPFIHDPKQVAVCTRFLKGKCDPGPPGSATYCPFAHEICEHKMPVCRFFVESFCTKDPCPFLHVNVGRAAPVCQDFQVQGYCSRGKACHMQHVARVCKDYRKNGVCTRGKDCKYTHLTPAKYLTKEGLATPPCLPPAGVEPEESGRVKKKIKYVRPRRGKKKRADLPASRFAAFLSLPGSDDSEDERDGYRMESSCSDLDNETWDG